MEQKISSSWMLSFDLAKTITNVNVIVIKNESKMKVPFVLFEVINNILPDKYSYSA